MILEIAFRISRKLLGFPKSFVKFSTLKSPCIHASVKALSFFFSCFLCCFLWFLGLSLDFFQLSFFALVKCCCYYLDTGKVWSRFNAFTPCNKSKAKQRLLQIHPNHRHKYHMGSTLLPHAHHTHRKISIPSVTYYTQWWLHSDWTVTV